MPTTESSSPTATRAVNEKRRPPLTTLATRLISITRSCRSSPFGLTVSTAMRWVKVAECRRASELQTPFPRALGECLDPAVIAVSAPVEDAGLDLGVGGALGDQLARLLGLLHRLQAAQLLLGPVDGGEGAAGVVVDELRRHAAVRAEHGQPRALRVAAN